MRPLTYGGLKQILAKTRLEEISPGLRFGLFFNGWSDDDYKPESKKKFEALKSVCELSKESIGLLDSLRSRQSSLASAAVSAKTVIFDREVISQSPFVTGMGLEHPLENGFSFLHPYGLPYLPGSSVKGVLRRAAEELALFEPEAKDWDIVKVWWLFGFDSTSAFFSQSQGGVPHPAVQEERQRWLDSYLAKLDRCDHSLAQSLVSALPKKEDREKWIMKPIEFLRELPAADMKSLRQSLHIRGALQFWDVYPKPDQNHLRVDIMNPHYNHYYQGDSSPQKKISPPGDWGTPNPIYFLTVPEGTSFRFIVEHEPVLNPSVQAALPREKVKALLDAAMEFAFTWLGFGAKTSIGYGLMAAAARPASPEATQISSQSRPKATSPETTRTSPVVSPVQRAKWQNVTLILNPGSGEIFCDYQGNKAFTREKDLAPPSILQNLQKKRKAKADVEVEPIGGNNFKIVKISKPG
jgi:CRISPR-associated protein Cmr6